MILLTLFVNNVKNNIDLFQQVISHNTLYSTKTFAIQMAFIALFDFFLHFFQIASGKSAPKQAPS